VTAIAVRGDEFESRVCQAALSCPCFDSAEFGVATSWVYQADGSAYRHVDTRSSVAIVGGRNGHSIMPPIIKGVGVQDALDCFLGDSRQACSPNEAIDREQALD
jgi:hypothetical protein